ncbi:MAG: hypothetical protein R3265_15340 [Hyphomonas sp.]|nr:hypothetical protein [Hyphomonas sp.]
MIKLYLLLPAVAVLTACSGGDVTRGDIYSACLDSQMRKFDNSERMLRKVTELDGGGEFDEAAWARERTKEQAKSQNICNCAADTLPDRMGQDRLKDVVKFYKREGTTFSKGTFDRFSEVEQQEIIKCHIQNLE